MATLARGEITLKPQDTIGARNYIPESLSMEYVAHGFASAAAYVDIAIVGVSNVA